MKKRAIDLALNAGRKRQSPRTGFVHFYPSEEDACDTIPLFENFCFAFALLRQKNVESILEGKGILERLLFFQTSEGNFPLYLHDYPKCYDPMAGLNISPILVQTLRHFGAVIGAELKGRIGAAIERIVSFSGGRSRPPLWEHRLAKLKGERGNFSPVSPEEWFHWLLSEQMGKGPISAKIPYHPRLQAFIGGAESQEKGEPRPLPIEWFLAEEEGFSERLLSDHPASLQASLFFPAEGIESLPSVSSAWIPEGSRFLWRGSKLHSLCVPSGIFIGPGEILFSLVETPEWERGDLIEAALFSDLSPETSIWVNGKRGTVFHFGDLVRIVTPTLSLDLRFELVEGRGDFCGQISRANRPAQTACKGALQYEAFDWRIALRTLRREPRCRIALYVSSSVS